MITLLNIPIPKKGDFTRTLGNYFGWETHILELYCTDTTLTLTLQGDNPPGAPMDKKDAEERAAKSMPKNNP